MVGKALRAAASRNARLQALAKGRLPQPGDDSGSLMFALLLIFVGTALASLMVPMFLIAVNGSRADARRVTSLAAAEAGINVVVGQIQAANDGSGNGVLSELPCGVLTGSVSAANTSRYQVTISYYPSDPRGQNSSWLLTNVIKCVAGAGALSAPSYGLIQSLGTDVATGSFNTILTRSLQATYIFQSTNANIAGGLIHVYKTSSSKDLCLDAGSGSPTAGTNVTMQACSSGIPQQGWAYNQNLTISLVSSETTSQPLGMCLDAGTPQASGLVLKLQLCSTVTKPQQQWSLNDSANFVGTSDGATLDSYCWNVQTQNVPGSLVILSTNCNGGYDNIQTFQPEAAVGAGAAGTSSGQLVNFSQFGRCMDVTEQNVNYGYIIAWPCKQAPDASNVTWNQRWALPSIASGQSSGTGQITTNPSGTLYCLQSPDSTQPGQYVIVTPCPANGTPTNESWTVNGDTGTYSTSYEIIDGYGNCLQPTDPTGVPPDFYPNGNNISKLIVQACNGSTLQKWNAPPDILQPIPLKDIGEH